MQADNDEDFVDETKQVIQAKNKPVATAAKIEQAKPYANVKPVAGQAKQVAIDINNMQADDDEDFADETKQVVQAKTNPVATAAKIEQAKP